MAKRDREIEKGDNVQLRFSCKEGRIKDAVVGVKRNRQRGQGGKRANTWLKGEGKSEIGIRDIGFGLGSRWNAAAAKRTAVYHATPYVSTYTLNLPCGIAGVQDTAQRPAHSVPQAESYFCLHPRVASWNTNFLLLP